MSIRARPYWIALIAMLYAFAGCMAEPRIEVKSIRPVGDDLVATIRTSTEVTNWVEGEASHHEQWFLVTYRIDRTSGRTSLVKLDEIAPIREVRISVRDEYGQEIDTKIRVRTPPAIAATGFSAKDQSGDQYLCTKVYRERSPDAQWAVMTADAHTIAAIPSIEPQGGRYLIDQAWNPETGQVAFRRPVDVVSGTQVKPIPVRVWTYRGDHAGVSSHVVELSRAFAVDGKRVRTAASVPSR